MAHREFAVAVKRAQKTTAAEPITFSLAGDDYVYCVRETLKEDAVALVWARLERVKGLGVVAGYEDVIRRMLTPESADHLMARIEDRDGTGDPLTLEDIIPVMNWVVEEYAGRPTESQPDL